jgi:hypothetical protein
MMDDLLTYSRIGSSGVKTGLINLEDIIEKIRKL